MAQDSGRREIDKLASRSPDKLHYDFRESLALILLEKMTGSGQGLVRLSMGARNLFLKEPVGAARNRVAVAESG
jgi:hypothetical protein